MEVLVAGMGNVLRRDDGFGVAVADALGASGPPPGVRVVEVGIGGIHMVQDLMTGVDALVIVDAVDLGRAPGTVLVIRPEVEDVSQMSLTERHDRLADMHFAVPERALMLARGLDVLPRSVWMVGCQPADAESFGEGLSDSVESAIEVAAEEVKRIIGELGIGWP